MAFEDSLRDVPALSKQPRKFQSTQVPCGLLLPPIPLGGAEAEYHVGYGVVPV